MRHLLRCLLNLFLLSRRCNLIYSQTESRTQGPRPSVPIWDACSYLALPVTVSSVRKSLGSQSKGYPPHCAFPNTQEIFGTPFLWLLYLSLRWLQNLRREKGFYLLVLWTLNWTLCWALAPFPSGREGISIASMARPSTTSLRKNQPTNQQTNKTSDNGYDLSERKGNFWHSKVALCNCLQ